MSTPLFVTADPDLGDQLLRLSAAAGVTPHVVSTPAEALARWRGASLVLVGQDCAEPLARLGPERREGVYVGVRGQPRDDTFPVALTLGAEGVVNVGNASEWLVERLGEVAEPAREPGRAIGVIGGSGGVGASVFAGALATLAARHGPSLLVDCDPAGPGLDRLLGLELVEGVRWDALHRTTGRLSGRALRESVPRRRDLGVLTWHSATSASLQAFAVREVLAAARRGHRTVVLDLPRAGGAVVDELVARLDAVVLVVAATVLGVASASRVAARLDQVPVHVLLRGGAVDEEQVREVTGADTLVGLGHQRGLDEAIDLGLGPLRSRRGPLARAAGTVLDLVP